MKINIFSDIKVIFQITCIIGSVFAIYYFLFKETDNSKEITEKCFNQRDSIFYGIIAQKEFSKRVYYVTKDEKLFFPRCREIKIELEVGDSIYKPANTFDLYVYKQANSDSVVFVECDFDCDIYLKNKKMKDSIN
jgi:hypothetical protein